MLLGKVEVSRVVLVKPVVNLEVLSGGRNNWTFATNGAVATDNGAAAGGEAAGADSGSQADSGSNGIDVAVNSLVIEDAIIIYSDADSGATFVVDNWNADISAGSLEGPFEASGSMGVGSGQLAFDIGVGHLSGQAVPVNTQLSMIGSETEIGFNGVLNELNTAPRINGRLTIGGRNLAATAAEGAAYGDARADLPIMVARPFSVAMQIAASQQEVILRELALNLDGNIIRGTAEVINADLTRFKVKLSADQFDLDALLDESGLENAGGDNQETLVGDGEQTISSQKPAPPPFAIPDDLTGAFSLSVASIKFRGDSINGTEVDLSVSDGSLIVERFAAGLPGAAMIGLDGRLGSVDGQPRFDGKLTANANSTRDLASWLGVSLAELAPDMPGDKLGKLTLRGTVTATPDVVQFYGIDLAVDQSRATGGVAWALQERPSFAIDMRLDQINLDDYAIASASNGDQKTTAPAKSGNEESADPFAALSVLGDFDANIKLAVGQVTTSGHQVTDAVADLSVLGGLVTANKVAIGDISGLALGLSGTVSVPETDPVFDLSATVKGKSLKGLEGLLGTKLPIAAEKLGAVKLSATAKGRADNVALALSGGLAKTAIKADGKVSNGGEDLSLNMKVRLSNDSFAKLVQQFDLPLTPPGRKADGRATLTASVAGDMAALKMTSELALAAGKVTVSGAANNLAGSPNYTMEGRAEAADFAAMVRGLGVDYEPAGGKVGPLGLKFSAQGDAANLTISQLGGRVGLIDMEGTADVVMAEGRRPVIKADVTAGVVDLDKMLPASGASSKKTGRAKAGKPAARPAPRPKGSARWSRDPVDLSALSIVDATVNLAATTLLYSGYEFEAPRLEMVVADGTFALKKLTGKLFDGPVSVKAELRGQNVPVGNMSFSLTNGTVEKAMISTFGQPAATGRFDISGKFSATGRSEFELVSGLNGMFQLNAQDGVIKKIDVAALNERLDNIDKPADILKLFGATLSGGETPYSAIVGDLRVVRGVVDLNDVKADLRGANVVVTGKIDLPNWVVASRAAMTMQTRSEAPEFAVKFRGPVDAPIREVDSAALQKYLTRKIAGKFIEKNLGGDAGNVLNQLLGGGAQTAPKTPAPKSPAPVETPPPTSKPAPTQPPADKTQEKIDNILRDVFRGLGN